MKQLYSSRTGFSFYYCTFIYHLRHFRHIFSFCKLIYCAHLWFQKSLQWFVNWVFIVFVQEVFCGWIFLCDKPAVSACIFFDSTVHRSSCFLCQTSWVFSYWSHLLASSNILSFVLLISLVLFTYLILVITMVYLNPILTSFMDSCMILYSICFCEENDFPFQKTSWVASSFYHSTVIPVSRFFGTIFQIQFLPKSLFPIYLIVSDQIVSDFIVSHFIIL